jgi:hypothetical protein
MTGFDLDQYGFNRIGRIFKKLRDLSYDDQSQRTEDRSLPLTVEGISKRLHAEHSANSDRSDPHVALIGAQVNNTGRKKGESGKRMLGTNQGRRPHGPRGECCDFARVGWWRLVVTIVTLRFGALAIF